MEPKTLGSVQIQLLWPPFWKQTSSFSPWARGPCLSVLLFSPLWQGLLWQISLDDNKKNLLKIVQLFRSSQARFLLFFSAALFVARVSPPIAKPRQCFPGAGRLPAGHFLGEQWESVQTGRCTIPPGIVVQHNNMPASPSGLSEKCADRMMIL